MNPLSGRAVANLQKILSEPDLSNTKYKLLKKIGIGGMAEVYLVLDTELDREAALKVIHPAHSSEDFSNRMIREAKIIARLEHPAIVPVHDVGQLPDGRIFYVMKFIQGEPLDTYSEKVAEIQDRLRIVQRICEAVSFAHSRGVIHRDLKPQNVMVGAFGEVQVMDWGLAKAISERFHEVSPKEEASTTGPSTDAGTLMGTPGYMAPEQVRGDTANINEKTDLYAIGAILNYLLKGETTKRLKAICEKAMSESPENRYQSVAQLSEDINSYRNHLPMIAYKENILEKIGRWISRHSFVLLLIVAYLIMRILLFLLKR